MKHPIKSRTLAALTFIILLTGNLNTQAQPTETKEQRDARMGWWRDARFGMFVHWGLYSGLAGNWNGKPVGKSGGMEWIQQLVKADTETYAAAALPKFQPRPGFAREWAKLAKQAGCRYLVFTTKHHEGFGLYASKFGDYNAGAKLNRDLVKEIVEACRAEGLRVGFYHSLIDWHHDQYDYTRAKGLPYPLAGRPSPNGPRDHAKYIDYLHQQVGELMSNYGPVDVIWWDFSAKDFQGDEAWRATDLIREVRAKQPQIVMNNRLFSAATVTPSDEHQKFTTDRGDFTTPEQQIPATGMPGVDWETCMTLNTTWGYSEHDHAWKSDRALIRNLIDIASKGGNYLLNIGPKGDGSLTPETVQSFQAIGAWMKVNGEAIYGCGPTAFGGEVGAFDAEKKDKHGKPLFIPAWDWRCTTKPGKLYIHIFQWPENGKFEIPAVKGKITNAYLLADPQQTALKATQSDTGVSISLPEKAPDAIASVVCVETKE